MTKTHSALDSTPAEVNSPEQQSLTPKQLVAQKKARALEQRLAQIQARKKAELREQREHLLAAKARVKSLRKKLAEIQARKARLTQGAVKSVTEKLRVAGPGSVNEQATGVAKPATSTAESSAAPRVASASSAVRPGSVPASERLSCTASKSKFGATLSAKNASKTPAVPASQNGFRSAIAKQRDSFQREQAYRAIQARRAEGRNNARRSA